MTQEMDKVRSEASKLWDAWRTAPHIRALAEDWVKKAPGQWSEMDDTLYGYLEEDPGQFLSVLLAVIQLRPDAKAQGLLGAGPFEDFLGVYGERYIDLIQSLALEHQQLRQALGYVWQGAMSKNVWHRVEVLREHPQATRMSESLTPRHMP